MMYHRKRDVEEVPSVTIRLTRPTDTDEIRRVAERDSRPAPKGELLVAIADGEIRAAISLSTGEVVADPFLHTAELVRMLTVRRTQMLRGTPGRLSLLRRLRLASG